MKGYNHFDETVDIFSPPMGDVERIVKFDDEGNEVISFVGVDYKLIAASRPTVEDYSLKALLAAGIDPSFGIMTGNNSRIEGVDAIHSVVEDVNKIFPDNNI